MELKGKSVLFIGVGFYDYDLDIVRKIRSYGATVDYFKDYPELDLYHKIIKRLRKNYENERVELYYKRLISKLSEHYDFIFIIKGDKLPIWFLSDLKNKYVASDFILYQWDSVVNVDNFERIKPFFDRVITFDRLDAEQYGFEFRPLFYRDIYFSDSSPSNKFDMYFSGSLHSDRYLILLKLLEMYKENKIKHHLYTGFFSFYINQFKSFFSSEKKLFKSLVSFKTISSLQNKKFMSMSQSVLDLHHPLQSGLTIRTIEALAMNNKIITTNPDVVNYSFYSQESVLIVDRDNLFIRNDFLNNTSFIYTEEEKAKYSLDSWVKDIFFKNQELTDFLNIK